MNDKFDQLIEDSLQSKAQRTHVRMCSVASRRRPLRRDVIRANSLVKNVKKSPLARR